TFTGSIDDRFWLQYGRFLLANKHPADVIREVLDIKRTSQISCQEMRYKVMRYLFESVAEYRGIVFYEELKNNDDDSQDFIFSAPVGYGHTKRIERLFMLTKLEDLRQLPDDKRKKLKEQVTADGVSLRYCEMREDKWPANFGIYGKVAVGTLKEKVNVINFDDRAVKSAEDDWNIWWKEAKPLKEEHL